MGEFTRLFGFNRSKAVMQDIVARPLSCITSLILATRSRDGVHVSRGAHLTWDQTQIAFATVGTATAVLIRILVSAGLLTAFRRYRLEGAGRLRSSLRSGRLFPNAGRRFRRARHWS